MLHLDEVELNASGEGTQPWDRWPEESTTDYARFCDYLLMGPRRTVRAAAIKSYARECPDLVGTELAPVHPYSSKYYALKRDLRWLDRAAAYDAELMRVRLQRYREAMTDFREREFEAAEQLLRRAMEMLNFPLVEEYEEEVVGEDGQVTVVRHVEPVRWNLRDAATLAEAASTLARRAAGAVGEEAQAPNHRSQSLLDMLTGKRRARVAIAVELEEEGEVHE